MKKYVPIFKMCKSDTLHSEAEFFVLHKDMVFDDRNEAHLAGMCDFGFMALYSLKFVRVDYIDIDNFPHIVAKLEGLGGTCRVAIISGVEFEKRMDAYNAKKDSAQ